jgi:uncharacterized C2H2 Zn-finger protein
MCRRTLYGRAAARARVRGRRPDASRMLRRAISHTRGDSLMASTTRRVAKRQSRRPASTVAAKTGARTRGLRCPDCDFVARHAMGLGRHRSARHGVVSQRQRRRDTSGGWVTRREAARRAGVHYNTIRHWEKTGRLRRRTSGGRGAMVNASDLDGLRGGGRRSGGSFDPERIVSLERRFNDLLDGLERLVSRARAKRS